MEKLKTTVFVKQVPDAREIKRNEDNTLDRTNAENIINPCDEYALEAARGVENNEITVASMGPMQACEMLDKLAARGAKNLYLLSDKRFAGSDTYATSYVLAQFVKKYTPDADLILCGQISTDGDTAQTGPGIATRLGYSLVTNVIEVEAVENGYVLVTQKTECGTRRVKANFPAVVCVKKIGREPQIPTIAETIAAKGVKTTVLTADDIDADPKKIGLKASPTRVKKVFVPKMKREGKIFVDAEEFAVAVAEEIKKAGKNA